MNKEYRKQKEQQVAQKRLKALIDRFGRSYCIKEDCTLNEAFVLSYLTKSNPGINIEYNKLISAFDELKKEESFKILNPLVKNSTLKDIEFYNEYLVRPIPDINSRFDNVYSGIIIKLPNKLASDNFPGEEWKRNLPSQFKIGDKLMYYHKNNIMLDGENLHLVSYFIGKARVLN